MTLFAVKVAVLVFAYLLGSIPTALVISLRIKRLDIRRVGDGNMGARNTIREIGPRFGVIVGLIDISKGALAVFLAHAIGLNLGWQMLTGILVILGHDFPIFANFKGGQGLAPSIGTVLVLFPVPTLICFTIYGLIFLVIKNSIVSCALGGAILALILGDSHQWLLLGYMVAVAIFIPIKVLIDSPRRRAIERAKSSKLSGGFFRE